MMSGPVGVLDRKTGVLGTGDSVWKLMLGGRACVISCTPDRQGCLTAWVADIKDIGTGHT